MMNEKMKNITVGIDKLVIGLPYPMTPKFQEGVAYPQEELAQIEIKRKSFHAEMHHIEKFIKLGNYHCGHAAHKDATRYKVVSEITNELLCVITLGFSYGTGVINFEINPSRMNEEKFAELVDLLTPMFNYDYVELYNRAVVKYCEFFINIPDIDLSQLILIDESKRIFHTYKGTTYYGNRFSKHVTTMYDKARQLKQDGELVRIEARLKDLNVFNLVEQGVSNPFSKIFPVDVNQLNLMALELHKPNLASQIKELGFSGAVKNKPARDKILPKLREIALPWWKPNEFWELQKQMLQGLHPANLGKMPSVMCVPQSK